MTNPVINTLIVCGMVLAYLIPAGLEMVRESIRRQEEWRRNHGGNNCGA